MKTWPSAAATLLILHAPPVLAQQGHESCVDVQLGTAQSYACINQRLQDIARGSHRSTAAPPWGAGQPSSNETGQFNEDAIRNRLGANYGTSVTPPRPAASFPNAFAAPK